MGVDRILDLIYKELLSSYSDIIIKEVSEDIFDND